MDILGLLGILPQLPSTTLPCIGYSEHFTMTSGGESPCAGPDHRSAECRSIQPYLQNGPGRGGQH